MVTERTVCFRVFFCDDLICVLVGFFVIKLLSYKIPSLSGLFLFLFFLNVFALFF